MNLQPAPCVQQEQYISGPEFCQDKTHDHLLLLATEKQSKFILTILVKINYCRLQNHIKQYNLASDHTYILPHPLLLPPSSFYYLISSSGILLVHLQSCFASAAPLPSFISSQPSILVLSLIHRQLQLSNRLSVTWSPPAHVSWYCTSYPVFSLRAECRRHSESLCSLTLPRSVMFESTQLPIYVHNMNVTHY